MKTIRVRHELPAANVALLARLGFVVEIDPAAPPCVAFAGGRNVEIREDGCRTCRRMARQGAPAAPSRLPVAPATQTSSE